MIKNAWVLLFLSCFLLSSLQTRSQSSNGLLFEVSGNGLKKPSYLFGSFTLAKKYKYAIDNNLLKYIDASDVVATEMDLVRSAAEFTDTNSLNEYCFRILATMYNTYFNEVYIPDFKTNEGAEVRMFESLKAGNASLMELMNNYASKLNFSSEANKTQWPAYKVMQYAVRKNKKYVGLQPADSIVLAYADFFRNNLKSGDMIFKQIQELSKEQQEDLQKMVPESIAAGKASAIFDQLKHLRNGADSIILALLNMRNKQIIRSILDLSRDQSVFAAVNYLALTNPEGILTELRKMGYKVKEIKMKRDVENTFSRIKEVPYEVRFNPVTTADGFLEFSMPGKSPELQVGPFMSAWVHLDVVNGSFFEVNRIKHNYTFKGKPADYVLKKIDSLIYEQVPGSIEKKELIESEFFTGYDIVSVNRNEDYQRSKFLITPFEIILIKCEGEKRYALQPSANAFFESLKLNTALLMNTGDGTVYQNNYYAAMVAGPHMGFEKPGFYHAYTETCNKDKNIAIVYAHGVYSTPLYLDEDTFLLNSTVSNFAEKIKLTERKRTYSGNSVTVSFKDEENRYYMVKVIKDGFFFDFVAASSADSTGASTQKYIDSFKPKGNISYPEFISYRDTALHATVTTFEGPLEEPRSRLMNLVRKAGRRGNAGRGVTDKSHTFLAPPTGETVLVSYSKYGDQVYFRDSVTFWKDLIEGSGANYEYKISRMKQESKDGVTSVSFLLTDTNTAMGIKYKVIQKKQVIYTLRAGVDTTRAETKFITTFFNTFTPEDDTTFGASIFVSRKDTFLNNLLSMDSATCAKSLYFTPQYDYTTESLPLFKAYLKSPIPNAEVAEIVKGKIMSVVGSIRDKEATDFLNEWYINAGDTSDLQMSLLVEMASQRTSYSFGIIKDILVNNPPAVKNSYQLNSIIYMLEDTPKLAASITLDLLTLVGNEDYKDGIIGLVGYLADSNYIDPKSYEQKVQEILLLGKNELKRENSKAMDEEGWTSTNVQLINYTKILIPFYNSNAEVRSFIDKCILAKNLGLRERIAYYLLKHSIAVHDSILESVARNDVYRYDLYEDLAELKLTSKIPAAYNDQVSYARSIFANGNFYNKSKYKNEDVIYIDKRMVYFHQKWGYVYLFKVKGAGYDYESSSSNVQWNLGLSGFQPSDTLKKEINSRLQYYANDAVKEEKTMDEQFDALLNRVINDRRHIIYSASYYGNRGGAYDFAEPPYPSSYED
jgi:uncharacterized protein YbaP (TraB family)